MSNKDKRKRERLLSRRAAAENRAASKRQKRAWKGQQRAKRNEIVAVALEKYESVDQKFGQLELHEGLKKAILGRARKLIDERFKHGLKYISDEAKDWVRGLEDWKPKGKSANSQFRSLCKHLFVKYTMPEFMYSVFLEETESVRRQGLLLFKHLGTGGSLYKLVKEGKFPVPLTKRMCHVFMESTVKLGFFAAVRHAQVLVYGGDRRVAEAVCMTGQLGYEFKTRTFRINEGPWEVEENFWATVLQWTCNQAMLAPSQFGPIYDWVGRAYHDNKRFSMKGRTGLSVLRAVEEWHGSLAKERQIHGHKYDPSGFQPLFYERKVRLPSGGHHIEKNCILEVGTSKELAAEGRALRHCVYSYSWSIQRGSVSIWSYHTDGTRRMTIEVRNKERRVTQVRGKNNRAPTKSEMAQIDRWVKDNNLSKASWLPVR